MLIAIPLISLALAAISEQQSSGDTVSSPYYGAYNRRTIYGADRLSEIEAQVLKIVRRYVKAWNIPKLISLNKQRDRLILAGKPPSDPEVEAIEEKAEGLLPNIPPAEYARLEALKQERDQLLRKNA